MHVERFRREARAVAHAELALGYFISGMHGMAPMREVAPIGRPRFILGGIALAHDYDWDTALAHFAASMRGPGVPAHARWIYASLVLHALGRAGRRSPRL